MKPTTYIIGGLVVLGAFVSGVGAYTMKSSMRNSLEPYAFSDVVETRTFASAYCVAISFHNSLPENTEVYFTSGINLEVTESDGITSPYIETSADWFPLLDLRETDCNGMTTLDIIIDAHGLADYYRMPDKSKKMEIHLDAPAIKLVMPSDMLRAISADEKCRVHLQDMTLTELNAAFNNRLYVENCDINSFGVKISGLNEYSVTYHEPATDAIDSRLPSVGEYQYSYLELKNSTIKKARITAVAPALTIDGPCYIDSLSIDAVSTSRDNQYIELRRMVGFDVLDWNPDNPVAINLDIQNMAAGRIMTVREN
ncbi:MAG: hypothetical protein K2H98_09435 [Duncaniella sp.]|nr:hypothetical protein [Duncaniella sp.]